MICHFWLSTKQQYLGKSKVDQNAFSASWVVQKVTANDQIALGHKDASYVGLMSRCSIPCLWTAASPTKRERKYDRMSDGRIDR